MAPGSRARGKGSLPQEGHRGRRGSGRGSSSPRRCPRPQAAGPQASGRVQATSWGYWGGGKKGGDALLGGKLSGNLPPAASQPARLTWMAFSSFWKRRISCGPWSMVGMWRFWKDGAMRTQPLPAGSPTSRAAASPGLGTGLDAQGTPGKRCLIRRLPGPAPPPGLAEPPSW